jgi:hexosaminidase
MPVPAAIERGQGALAIGETFRVTFTGYREARLEAAAARLVRRLSAKTGIPITGAGQGAAVLEVRCQGAGAPVQTVRDNESYRLAVTPRGATLEAPTPLGVLRGLATFAQLIELGPSGFAAPAVTIDDRPRFAWRGFMLDVSRHWMPMDVIERTLNGMAAVKLNVFHIHLSDDQGFRIESKGYPKLHGMGSDGNYFTQDQVRHIIAYARERGIRVIPEFDMPGHTGSWFPGYPELAAAPGPYRIERGFGVNNPCMDPTKEEVYRFLDGFIGEMAALFPDEYFHIGGDEVNGKDWNASASIQQYKRAHGIRTNEDLQAGFTRRVQAIVAKHGKKMIGWDEVMHPDLPRDIVIHSWRGQKSLAQAAGQGFSGILSNGYYLDLMQHTDQHYLVDPLSGAADALPPGQKSRILGGEACEWAELITPENVDARIWPRAAAIAERLWSPQDVRDVDSMYRRLAVVARDLEYLGLEHQTGFDRMTARLAGSHDPAPVRVLADVVEPVKEYKRHNSRKYTQFTPLNRLVDVARPDSRVAREFGARVDSYLADKTGREEIRRQLIAWRDNDALLAPIVKNSALLAEAAPLSQDLAALAAAALEALGYIDAGRHDRAWVERQSPLLDRAAKPRAELLLSAAPPLRKLIEAAR